METKNWNEARKQCQSMQSDLMSISTKYEQTFLQGELLLATIVHSGTDVKRDVPVMQKFSFYSYQSFSTN